MANELKPCPFCGVIENESYEEHSKGCYIRKLCDLVYDEGSTSEATHGEEAMRNAYNTRYERTCTPLLSSYWVPKTMEELPGDYEAPVIICSECEHEISFDETYDPETDFPSFCEKCGCKIVGPVKEYQ